MYRYVLCTYMYIYCIDMSYTCLYMYVPVCIMYIHVYVMYRHVEYVFVQVCTCMYNVHTCICKNIHLPVLHCMLVQYELRRSKPLQLFLIHFGKKASIQSLSMRQYAAICGDRNWQPAEQWMQSVETSLLLALQATEKLVDGLLCFCSIWPGIEKITVFWTGTALIHIVPFIRGPRDIPQSCICISVLTSKSCWDNWLYHVHTVYIHVYTWYIHVHLMYIHVHIIPWFNQGIFPPVPPSWSAVLC